MKILLADDHHMLREALIPFIERVADDVEVVEAEDLDGAVGAAVDTDELSLIILDLSMPGMNGVAGLKRMLHHRPDVPTVILSGTASTAMAVQMVRHGAAGFIPKTYRGMALVNALKLVFAGERYLPSSVVLNDRPGHSGRPGTGPMRPDAGDADDMSTDEQGTLALLKDGLSNKEIARRLDLQEVTVKKRLGRIYRKLGVNNRAQAVRAIIENELRH
jgi:DNA-binding NarL/FixJ family response regulator